MQFGEAPGQAAAGVEEGAVGWVERRERRGVAGAVEGFGAELVGVAKMAAGQFDIMFRLGRELTQQEVGFEHVAAHFEEPAELVGGDGGFAAGDHRSDFVEVVGAVADAARVNQDPAGASGGAGDRNAAFGRGGGAALGAFGHGI